MGSAERGRVQPAPDAFDATLVTVPMANSDDTSHAALSALREALKGAQPMMELTEPVCFVMMTSFSSVFRFLVK